jgi:patatin-like phospholipase/acyl hydrolase
MEKMRRILSIDGGGIKGVLPAAFLACLEETSGKRIIDHFDLLAGTSTGGIVALGLGVGLTAREILEFYETEGPGIFGQRLGRLTLLKLIALRFRGRVRSARRLLFSKYEPSALHNALEKAFGPRILGDSRTRLLIPAFDRQRREVHVFKTSHDERFVFDWKQRAVDVALATAAAPTYLPSHRLSNGVSLLDGGIWANNPTGIAAVEAIGVLGWPKNSIYILSIGCTEEPITVPMTAGTLGLALKMADIFLLGQSKGALGTAKLLIGHTEKDKRLFRYQHMAGPGEFDLDATGKIMDLKGIGMNMAREAACQILPVFFGSACEKFVPYHGPQ